MTQIRAADLDDARVIHLLETHVSRARRETAAGSAHALDLDGLKRSAVAVWTAWDGEMLVGVAALKRLSADHGELKSMFTAESARRSGVGSALLEHVVEQARADGLTRLSLETGSSPYFAAARSFYAGHEFSECQPFGEYRPDPNSVFMSRDLVRRVNV
jgi:putative acetyltransferase